MFYPLVYLSQSVHGNVWQVFRDGIPTDHYFDGNLLQYGMDVDADVADDGE